MSRPNKEISSARPSGSLPLTVGSAVGALMGILATQVESKAVRDALAAAIPVAAVLISALTAFVSSVVRQRWLDAEHERAARKVAAKAQLFMNDQSAPAEVREHAQQVFVSVSIAQMNYQMDALNRASSPPSDPSRKRAPRISPPKSEE